MATEKRLHFKHLSNKVWAKNPPVCKIGTYGEAKYVLLLKTQISALKLDRLWFKFNASTYCVKSDKLLDLSKLYFPFL